MDDRNLPGWGPVLGEWVARIDFASSFYELDGRERQMVCQDAGVDYYVLYGSEPLDIEPVHEKWKDRTIIKCPTGNSNQ